MKDRKPEDVIWTSELARVTEARLYDAEDPSAGKVKLDASEDGPGLQVAFSADGTFVIEADDE